jgi:hypothetical protein
MRTKIVIPVLVLGTLALLCYAQPPPIGPLIMRFLDLTDTPAAYTGEGGKYVRINVAETDLEFAAVAGGGDLLSDGSVPLTANWDVGNFDITLKALIGDGTLTGDKLELTGSNVTYLNITDDIETAIAAATAGDTIVLAAGTYTIVDDIDIAQAINIIGQGRYGTIINTTTDNKNIFHVTASNVGIYNLGITVEASGATSVLVDGTGGAILTNVFVEGLSIIHTSHAGVQYGIHYIDASGVIKACLLALTSTDESVIGIYTENEATAEAATLVRVLDTVITTAGGATPVAAFAVQDDGAAQDCELEIYYSSTYVTETVACASGGLYTFGGANAKATAEFCALKATDYDAFNAAGTLTLRNTLLYSNTTSGTITVQGSSQFQAVIADSFDGKGAVDIDYGSVDITDHTFTTDDSTFIIDGGITISTGDNITLGVVQWNSADEIDGTKIKDADYGDIDVSVGGAWTLDTDSVADNEIDYSNVTFADFDYETAWRMWHSNAAGDVTEIVLGADGTFLESNGAAANPAFRALVDGDIPDNITIDLATLASTVTTADDENSADNQEVVFTTTPVGAAALETDGDFHYNPSTGTVTATQFVGGGSGLTLASTDLTDTADLLYETELDSFAELDAQIADKALVNKADGAVWLGIHDFGGAGSFEIVNDANPTTDAAGEIALDTTITDHQPLLQYYDGGENMTVIAIDTAQLPALDNEIVKYDAGTDKFVLEADVGAGGGNDTYIEEGDAARVNSSGADLYVDFDATDFDVGVVGNEGNITIVDDGHSHTTTSISGLLLADMGDSDHGDVEWATGVAYVQAATIADSTYASCYVGLFQAATGNNEPFYTDGGLTYDATSGTLSSTVLTEGGLAVYNSGETPGGSLGGTWASPTIDDLFIKLGGDVATAGDYDFGGADFELPQASPAVPDADGEVELDFTDGKIAELGVATDVVMGSLISSFGGTITAPDLINDVITVKAINSIEFPHGIVITAIYLGISSDTGYVLTFQNFDDFDTINAANPTIDTVTYVADTTGEIIDSSPTYSTIAAGQIIMISIPATDVDWIH